MRLNHPKALPFSRLVLQVCIALPLAGRALGSEGVQPDPNLPAKAPIELKEGLAIAVDGSGRRSPIATDPIATRIVAGDWAMPKPGEEVPLFDGSKKKWELAKSNKDGHFALPNPHSYLAFDLELPDGRPMILEAAGHSMVYVNDAPRFGDLYSLGFQRIPVTLRKGHNTLLFHSTRGGLRARLVAPKGGCELNAADMTTPDFIIGQAIDAEAAIVTINVDESTRDGLAIRATLPDGTSTTTPLPPLLPSSTRKLGFQIRGAAPTATGPCEVKIELIAKSASTDARDILDTAKVGFRVHKPEQARKITFRSSIDGSLQYYALVPALPELDPKASAGNKPGLVLTLHGAGVEGIGQAESYAPKPGLNIVAATNRRPFGFDWEDWGRLDALEVLKLARTTLDPDPTRIYLTGHSMGGHGTWQLGVTFPDHFAAIAPSAGWISMWSYAGLKEPNQADREDPVKAVLARAITPSDTLSLARNLNGVGVYILHGDADDNVPADQARRMRRVLGDFHPDFVYHEQPGAGHWWGNPCVDWPPLFAFFETRRLPSPGAVRKVDFITASPGVSPRSNWLTIEAQQKPLAFSEVHFTSDPEHRKFKGTTLNVQRLAIDTGLAFASNQTERPVNLEIDGQSLPGLKPIASGESNRIWLERSAQTWTARTSPPPPEAKGPTRYGPFKNGFRNRVVFIFGTKGTAEENRWSFLKARYDAETFGYRGNGSIDVISDETFLAAQNDESLRDRDLVVYGHADLNAAWKSLLGEGPVQIHREKVRCGDRETIGDDLACLVIRPRPGSDRATVCAVGGTGPRGLRLTDRLPYFVSGVGYPDFFLINGKSLIPAPDGGANPGLLAAGFFGPDWGIDTGDFAWFERLPSTIEKAKQ